MANIAHRVPYLGDWLYLAYKYICCGYSVGVGYGGGGGLGHDRFSGYITVNRDLSRYIISASYVLTVAHTSDKDAIFPDFSGIPDFH